VENRLGGHANGAEDYSKYVLLDSGGIPQLFQVSGRAKAHFKEERLVKASPACRED
jgi:hypothetical protein